MQEGRSLTQQKIPNGSRQQNKNECAPFSAIFHKSSTCRSVFCSSPLDSSRAKTSLLMREAKFEDYPQITALEAKYGLEVKSYEDWKHLWSNNLVCREYQERLPIGWVLEDGGRSI